MVSPSTRLLPKCTLENITNLLMYRFVISTKQGCVPNYPGVIHKRFIIEWWWAWWEDSDLRTGGQRLWNRRRGVSELQWQINGNSPVESFSGLHVCRRRDTGGGKRGRWGTLRVYSKLVTAEIDWRRPACSWVRLQQGGGVGFLWND